MSCVVDEGVAGDDSRTIGSYETCSWPCTGTGRLLRNDVGNKRQADEGFNKGYQQTYMCYQPADMPAGSFCADL